MRCKTSLEFGLKRKKMNNGTLKIRTGKLEDVAQIKNLAVAEWAQFRSVLTPDNWSKLHDALANEKTYADLMKQADSFVYENDEDEIIGFGFLVPSGNPTEIYNDKQCYIRFITAS